jgi:hypothetical protein
VSRTIINDHRSRITDTVSFTAIYGRGGTVGRSRGVGAALGVGVILGVVVGVAVAVAVEVGVALVVGVAVPVGVAVEVAVGVDVAVAVAVGVGLSQKISMLSILQPSPGTPLESLPIRHRSMITCPAGRATLVVIKPPEFPVHASRPAIGLQKSVEIDPL